MRMKYVILMSNYSILTSSRYLWLYIIILKSFLVYMLDIFSAVTMLSTNAWSNQIFNQCKTSDGCIPIPFQTGKWLFVGCIIFGFLLVRLDLPTFDFSRKTLLVGI